MMNLWNKWINLQLILIYWFYVGNQVQIDQFHWIQSNSVQSNTIQNPNESVRISLWPQSQSVSVSVSLNLTLSEFLPTPSPNPLKLLNQWILIQFSLVITSTNLCTIQNPLISLWFCHFTAVSISFSFVWCTNLLLLWLHYFIQ